VTTSEYALVLAGVAAAVVLATALLVPAFGGLFQRAACVLGARCERAPSTAGGFDPWDDPDPVRRATWGKVVVLGDSYSSGEAADDYGAAGSTESCHASANAYGPRLVHRLRVAAARFTIRACTGATIANLAGPYREHRQPPQLAGLDAETSLVALTIGGNDLGWSDVILSCVAPWADDCHDGTPLAADVDRRIDEVGTRLEQTYRAIRRRAPNARVVVVGYPRFFPSPPTNGLSYSGLTILDIGEQTWMNDEFDAFNAVIARSAVAAGVEFVDAGAAFRHHELTSAHPWMRGPAAGASSFPVSAASFHPTAAGQRRLADLVEEQIRFPGPTP
jgi:lysophospholipase L1-like esterase